MAPAAGGLKAQKMDLPGPRAVRSFEGMKGYGQFCPVAKAAEIFAERWTPLVLRELVCGSHRFSHLHRGVPLMSRTLLAQRLAQLEDAGIVRSAARTKGRGREYFLTPAGEELRPVAALLSECLRRAPERRPTILDVRRRLGTHRGALMATRWPIG